MNVAVKPRLRSTGDPARTFADDVMAGLLAEPKRLPPKYFYDEADRACSRRSRRSPNIIRPAPRPRSSRPMPPRSPQLVPADAAMIEFGAGSSAKTRILLRAARQVDGLCSRSTSPASSCRTRRCGCARIARPAGASDRGRLHQAVRASRRARREPRVGFFPGSTIGNFEPHEAARLPAPCRDAARARRAC